MNDPEKYLNRPLSGITMQVAERGSAVPSGMNGAPEKKMKSTDEGAEWYWLRPIPDRRPA